MLRRRKTESTEPRNGPPRLLLVEDHEQAARLLNRLLLAEGFAVAEVDDHASAVAAIEDPASDIAAVVISYSIAGTSACLKLLDAIRHAPEPRVAMQVAVVVLDSHRQHMFTWQSAADDVLVRPYAAEGLVDAVRGAVERPNDERAKYRARQLERVQSDIDRDQIASEFAGFGARQH